MAARQSPEPSIYGNPRLTSRGVDELMMAQGEGR